MKIYVISLSDELKRKEAISKQLNLLDINFSFYDAVDLRCCDDKEIKNRINGLNKSGLYLTEREMTPGEIGCFLSHRGIMNELVFSDVTEQFALVIEDDAEINNNFPIIINKITQQISSEDICILGYSKLNRMDEKRFFHFQPISRSVKIDAGYIGQPIKQWTCGTVCYLIGRNAAKKIIESNHISFADDWLMIKALGINVYHFRPLLVFENNENFYSSIEHDRKIINRKSRNYLDCIRYIRGYFWMARLWFMKFKSKIYL